MSHKQIRFSVGCKVTMENEHEGEKKSRVGWGRDGEEENQNLNKDQ